MGLFHANNSKAQLKIQQMAFMIVALVVFFAMVGLIYFSLSLANLKEKVTALQDEEARELVRKFTGTPEFIFTASGDCSSCIDLDKVYQHYLNGELYKDFWNIDYLMIERIYSLSSTKKCTSQNYPECQELELIKNREDFEAVSSAFVTLARWDPQINDYRYEFGRIHVSITQND